MLQTRPVFGRGVFCLLRSLHAEVGFTQKNRLETVQAEGEGGKSLKKARRGKNWLVASSLLLCL